ncbi:hypothetical protein [Streptomyces sp. IBSBF 2435]|uniref:hypothetical protein n=1 Tax=Streptomyces sp. IBSBF 2435 TaxID=2903531 RepID=UPI002FDBDC67
MPNPLPVAGPAQQPEEERAADQRGQYAERQFRGRGQRTGGGTLAATGAGLPSGTLPGAAGALVPAGAGVTVTAARRRS